MQTRFGSLVRLMMLWIVGGICHAEIQVDAVSKPGSKWQPRPTQVLRELPPLPEDGALDKFGGLTAGAVHGTGFFRTEQIGGRWWLIDPAGGRFLSRGVNSVNLPKTADAQKALAAAFGSAEKWPIATVDFLRQNGFNTLGAWSDAAALAKVPQRMPHTQVWNFMAAYGKKRGGTRQDPGHTGYPGDCPFLFDPGFAPFCEEYARQLDAVRDDPWIVGHFSDNEMPWSRKMLENYLALPAADPGHLAAAAWLKARKGTAPIAEEDRAAFLAFALDRYLTTVGTSLREHAPHHLFLGPRLHGKALRLPEVFQTLGKHVDVISMNYYGVWTPDAALLEMWTKESGKPFIVTEFYAKGMDSGLANTGGAGGVVKTQKDRGAFYQNFTLALLRSRGCVGWSWHRYADSDPADKGQDAGNSDSNKGLLNDRYRPFSGMLDGMRELNRRAYGLAARTVFQK